MGAILFGVANWVHIHLKPTSMCGINFVGGGGGGLKGYEEDLPADQDLNTLSSEIDVWRHQLELMPRMVVVITDIAAKALVLASETETYTGVVHLFTLVCTWPVTTASCDRYISVLRILKSYTRSTIG